MINLARGGVESVSIHATSEIQEIRHKLAAWGISVNMTAEKAIGNYGAARRLAFFTAVYRNEETGEVFHTKETYVSENSIQMLLSGFINSKIKGIEKIILLPGVIGMRLMGNIMKGIEALQRDIGGEIEDIFPVYRPDIPGTSTMIYFTPVSLGKNVQTHDMFKKILVVHTRSKEAILQYLSLHGIEYVSEALGTPDWNEVEIKICDSDKLFELQHERLLAVIQGLQVGIILEEKWEREQALAKRNLPVYAVKIFTPFAVDMIKKIAMGLEYDAHGNRFADMDVYHKGIKVPAFTQYEKYPGYSRCEIGLMNRSKIMKNLDFDSMNSLFEAEKKIDEKKKN